MLKELFPTSIFGAPATESDLANVELILNVTIPEQLRALYLECDGFREDRGNAKYLLSLTNEDYIGSLVSTTTFFWTEFTRPDLTAFIFFGSSSGDEAWGIDWRNGDRVIAYHHRMEQEYEERETNIIDLYRADYARYDDL